MAKTYATKERIRNLIFLIFGGIGSVATFPAVLVAYSEYAASSRGTSRRFPPENIADYRSNLIFSLVILVLFVIILIYPQICRKTGRRFTPSLLLVGLTGVCCFVKIALEVANVVKHNLQSDPDLNIITTYGPAILFTAIPLAFFLWLTVYCSRVLVKERFFDGFGHD